MKVEKLLIGRLYKCIYPNREGEYVYVGEHLIGYCFNGCGGNRNIAMSERMVEKYIHETDQAHFTKVIDLYEHTGWCISLDGVNPYDLLDSEICQGCIIGNVFDNPEFLKDNL